MPDKKPSLFKNINIKLCLKRFAYCAAIGLAITLFSALMPIMVKGASELDAMKFGGPVPFVIQSTQNVPPPEWFPNYAAPKYFLYETSFLPLNFLLSVAINILAVSSLYILAVFIKKAIISFISFYRFNKRKS